MEIVFPVHRQIPGFRKVGDNWVPGEMLAMRKGGDEILFAPTPELPEAVVPNDVPKEPMAWIPVGEFSANPFCLAYGEDFAEDDELPQVPQRRGPMSTETGGGGGPKRRGK